jgi:hypothetical protein
MADEARERARERAAVEAERVWVNARGYYRAGYMNGWDARDVAAREEGEDGIAAEELVGRIQNRMAGCSNRQGHGGIADCRDCWGDSAALARWRGRRNA